MVDLEHLDEGVQRGRAALARADWAEARREFDAALTRDETPEALEGLSWVAWWTGDTDLLFASRESAYALYRKRDDRLGAVRMAMWLGTDSVDFRGEFAVAGGWLSRARRLLVGLEDSAEYGWLCVHEGEQLIYAEDTAAARARGAQAAEAGRRLDNTALEMMGLAVEGLALVTEGEVARGMRGLDEAATAALAGEFGERVYAGFASCFVIYACERVRDYSRASEWCVRAVEYAERTGMESLNRLCRAHHAGVLIWRGMWTEAESELIEAQDALSVSRPALASEAVARLGELRRRQGDFDEADALFVSAGDHPLAALGLAYLAVDRGDPHHALDLAERFLRETPASSRTERASWLELAIGAHVALGDLDSAAAVLDELREIGEILLTDPVRGCVSFAAGSLEAAAGEHQAAARSFSDALHAYGRAGAPYEAARARIGLARSLVATGRTAQAGQEAERAAESLLRLGAAFEAERARSVTHRPPSERSLLTPREQEVLRLIADGATDREVARALVLSEHTVHRHASNILAKLGARSRSAAVAEALRRRLL
ncbi:LuxR C-terminal-related transcriptional regulator [Paraconexibacter sp.]|uniref:LuxR C-terminal-related transcriptional regulator n=1 Tax=Paraconexibacter sp. TaxID=2949640 RepID=UPI0035680E3B